MPSRAQHRAARLLAVAAVAVPAVVALTGVPAQAAVPVAPHWAWSFAHFTAEQQGVAHFHTTPVTAPISAWTGGARVSPASASTVRVSAEKFVRIPGTDRWRLVFRG